MAWIWSLHSDPIRGVAPSFAPPMHAHHWRCSSGHGPVWHPVFQFRVGVAACLSPTRHYPAPRSPYRHFRFLRLPVLPCCSFAASQSSLGGPSPWALWLLILFISTEGRSGPVPLSSAHSLEVSGGFLDAWLQQAWRSKAEGCQMPLFSCAAPGPQQWGVEGGSCWLS